MPGFLVSVNELKYMPCHVPHEWEDMKESLRIFFSVFYEIRLLLVTGNLSNNLEKHS